jgi:outer membrane protein assembly factor BamB
LKSANRILALMAVASMTAAAVVMAQAGGGVTGPNVGPTMPPVAGPATASAPASAPTTASSAVVIGWRGDGTGVFKVDKPPTEWDQDAKKNVLWSVKVGKSLYGSPIVVGDKVFVLREESDLVCVDAKTGNILWEKSNGVDQLAQKPENVPNPGETGFTTPTPISDGKNVWFNLGNGIVACYDLDGNRKWITILPEPVATAHGRSASPALAGDKLIVSLGSLTALEAATGKTLWKAEKAGETYGSPVVGKIGGVDFIFEPTGKIVRASDGKIVSKGIGQMAFGSPVVQDGVVYYLDTGCIAGQLPKEAADALKLKSLWEEEQRGEFYSTGVVYDGIAYAVSDQGSLYARDIKDKGKELWKQDLDIPNASGRPGAPPGHLYPSLAIAGKYLYVTNDQGDTLVLEPGKQYKEFKRCKLSDGSGGNLFFAGNRIYARAGEKLVCIGEK